MKGPFFARSRHRELRNRGEAEGAGLTWRNVAVPIRRRPVPPVEEVLDLELDSPVLIHLCIKRGIDPDEAGQAHAVVRRREGVGEIDHADGGRPGRVELIRVAQRHLVAGNKLHAIARDNRRGRVAGDARIGVGVAE